MKIDLMFLFIFAGLCGLVMGSFYNVVIYRHGSGVSIIRPRSYCPHCKTTLQTADLVPLFSYIFLRGRCRYCNVKISIRYTVVELLSAALFVAATWRFGLSLELIKYIPLFSILLIISAIDLERHQIPNLYTAMILAWALLWQLISPGISWIDAALGLLAGGGITLLIALASRGGMGAGDVKLLAVLGFLAGWFDLLIIFMLAVLLGAAAGIFLIVFRKKTGKTPIPFGPFIALAYFMVVFWGSLIWGFYFSLISSIIKV
ncbi:MAG: prepilin peptidase [Dethiobacteria bacterium]